MPRAILQCIRTLLLISAIVAGEPALSLTVTEEFLTTARKDAADLIWNIQLGKLHAPFTVYDWDYDPALPGPQNRDIDVGTGAHGVFDATTYPAFDIDGIPGNNVIVIDTDQYPSGLNVTRFELNAGITLSPVGSAPLVIKSLSEILIYGTIDCSGRNGEDLNAVNTTIAAGGQGRCGGGGGGDGGTLALPAASGADGSATATGGSGGGAGGPSGGIGGGGGGAYNISGASSDNGEDPNIAGPDDGGAAGLLDSGDPSFADLSGGGGGAGGGASTNGVNDSNGGGGGGGGGVILLAAVGTISIANGGFVLANGGNGGGGGAGLDGGGGGGGGGGSIAMFAGEAIFDEQVLGVSADGGAGGVTANLTNGGSHGGSGVTGRIWMTDSDATLAGGGSEPGYANALIGLGSVLPREGAFSAQSTGIELYSSIPLITAVNLVTQSTLANTLTVEFASGDSPGFNPAGLWIDSSLYVGETPARFLKFRVTMTLTDHTQASPAVDSIGLTYDQHLQTQFDFKSGCGHIHAGGTSAKRIPPVVLAALLLPLLSLMYLRRKKPLVPLP